MWTNTSWPPLSGLMNPYPLVALNHFTVPFATSKSPQKRKHDHGDAIRGNSVAEGRLAITPEGPAKTRSVPHKQRGNPFLGPRGAEGRRLERHDLGRSAGRGRHQGAKQDRTDHGLAALWGRKRIDPVLYAWKHDLDIGWASRCSRRRAPLACRPDQGLGLFRSESGVAAGAAWGRNDGHLTGAWGRWRADFGINAGWRTQHPIGLGEFVAQRFVGLAHGVIRRRLCAAPPHRRATRRRLRWRWRGLLWGRRRRRWGLRHDLSRHHERQTEKKHQAICLHASQTSSELDGSRTNGFFVIKQAKFDPHCPQS